MRDELLEQVAGEFREFVLELELHAGGQERGALQEPGNHRIHPVADDAAEPFGDAGILRGELGALLLEKGEFAVVQFEELRVHRPRAR
jgi:hypothetical protein